MTSAGSASVQTTLVDIAHTEVADMSVELATPATPATLEPAAPSSAPVGSLFQSLGDDSSDGTDSDSDADLDHNKANEDWSKLMLELDTLKIGTGSSTKGKKKGKANVVMETPEMVKLKAKISKVEKDYMFSRKDAG